MLHLFRCSTVPDCGFLLLPREKFVTRRWVRAVTADCKCIVADRGSRKLVGRRSHILLVEEDKGETEVRGWGGRGERDIYMNFV